MCCATRKYRKYPRFFLKSYVARRYVYVHSSYNSQYGNELFHAKLALINQLLNLTVLLGLFNFSLSSI